MDGPPTVSIVIADDRAVVRAETYALLGAQAQTVLVLDLRLGRKISLGGAFARVRASAPSTAIVILTMDDDPAFVQPAWTAGPPGMALYADQLEGQPPAGPDLEDSRHSPRSPVRWAAKPSCGG